MGLVCFEEIIMKMTEGLYVSLIPAKNKGYEKWRVDTQKQKKVQITQHGESHLNMPWNFF